MILVQSSARFSCVLLVLAPAIARGRVSKSVFVLLLSIGIVLVMLIVMREIIIFFSGACCSYSASCVFLRLVLSLLLLLLLFLLLVLFPVSARYHRYLYSLSQLSLSQSLSSSCTIILYSSCFTDACLFQS